MKGHKSHHHRKHKAEGGGMDSPSEGSKEWEEDKSPSEVYAGKGSNVEKEADERKHGGRAKRKHGGKVHGKHAMHHAGRHPRKSGGRSGSNFSPLSSAHGGTPPKGHKAMDVD